MVVALIFLFLFWFANDRDKMRVTLGFNFVRFNFLSQRPNINIFLRGCIEHP